MPQAALLSTDKAVDALKVPPHSVEAEQAVLGGLMLDNNAWDRVADLVSEADFYRGDHRRIFEAVRSLAEHNSPFDAVTLAEWLDKRGELDRVGGISYLGALANNTPSAANIKHYAAIVRERSVLRQLIGVANTIADSAFSPEGRKVEELLDEAEKRVYEIADQGSRSRQGFHSIKDLLVKAVDRIDQLFERDDPITGTATGFTDFDNMTAGLQPSDLVIIAGRPSMGKCVASDTEVTLEDGSVETIETLYHRKAARLFTLNDDWRIDIAEPSAYVDDGVKPVFRMTTRLGRQIETTATHPYLTPSGWRPLGELSAGEHIAVPRVLEVFGSEDMRDCEVKLLAYLLGDGCLTQGSPRFTNTNPRIQNDFISAANEFGAIKAVLKARIGRASDVCVAADHSVVTLERRHFADSLRVALEFSGLSDRQFAIAVGASPASVWNWTQGKTMPGEDLFGSICAFFKREPSDWLPKGRVSAAKNSRNRLTDWLDELGVWGKDAHEKFVPGRVFRLPERKLALFLSRLFATDGWATLLKSGQGQLGYASVSERLARQIQHLLLRFGVIAKLRARNVRLKGRAFSSWQLDITDSDSIRAFAGRIGIYGKEEGLRKVVSAIDAKRYQTNADLIPKDFWRDVARSKGEESWSALARRAGITGSSNIHVGKRALSRPRLGRLANALGDNRLRALAESHVYWDEIVSIEPMGVKQVYDLTIPRTHNFVANDICVHNTTFAMNIAENAAIRVKKPVAVFSMEMPGEQLALRLLSSLGRIDQHRIRTGKLDDDDWPRLTSAVGILAEAPMYIDDTPALTPTELRARARRLAREHEHGLGLIVIDYLQLMQVAGNSENRATEISEISRSLKALAKELHVPVIALSQLNRSLEQRPNKRPVMSDLRESGAIEQDADVIVFIYRDEVYNPESEDKGTAEIIIGKQRNGPIGTCRLTFLGQYTRFENHAGGGYSGGEY